MGQFPHRRALAIALLLALPVFFIGQTWGLPSRSADPYLFGGQVPWTGAEILRLSGGWMAEPTQGADVASAPLQGREQPLIVNLTDIARAKILLRYRLYSKQPDEASTFRSLGGMHPGRGPRGGMDPRLYQYGGLWIYPIGILLKLLPVTLRSDVAWYLDHPDSFGQFYVIARCYSAAWGLAGVAVVFLLIRRICGGWALPLTGSLLFTLLPVVVNQSHEGKPHLAGAVLMLGAALAGSIYVETGKLGAAISTGALCGAATGMILSCYPVFLIIPLMMLLRGRYFPRSRYSGGGPGWGPSLETAGFSELRTHLNPPPGYRGRTEEGASRTLARTAAARFALSFITGIGVYFAANPYVAINLVCNREVLHSNLGTSAAMYHAGLSIDSLRNASLLIMNGAGVLTAIGGVIGALLLARRAVRRRKDAAPAEVRRRATGLLLAAPSIWIAVQFIAFASNKPGEYGRFALYLDIVLAIEAIVAIQTFARSRALQFSLATIMLLSTGWLGLRYLAGFVRDCRPDNSRIAAAQLLADLNHQGKHLLRIADEPAPYCLPPVDLFSWQIELAPRGQWIAPRNTHEVSAKAMEDDSLFAALTSTRISWADKQFEINVSESP